MQTTRVFTNGNSQAVRLPKEFRFAGTEVFIRRDEATGDVVLSAHASAGSWADFFKLRASTRIPEDFLSDRPLNEIKPMRDPLSGMKAGTKAVRASRRK